MLLFARTAVALSAVLLLANALRAQTAATEEAKIVRISGYFVDTTGAVIPTVSIKLTALNSDQTIALGLTNGSGEFHLSAPSGGIYELSGEMPGFKTHRQRIDTTGSEEIDLRVITMNVAATICPVEVAEAAAPPFIRLSTTRHKKSRVDVEVEATTVTSKVKRCEFSLDSGPWIRVETSQSSEDIYSTHFRFVLDHIRGRNHTIAVRVYDDTGIFGDRSVVVH